MQAKEVERVQLEKDTVPTWSKAPRMGRLLLVYYAIFLALVALAEPHRTLLSQFMNVRSEYTLYEQLQKYYLLVVILAAIYIYKTAREPTKVKLSILFLILSLPMYLAESNMITEKTQPLFAILFLPLIFYWFYQERAWISFLLLFSGFATLAFAASLDVVSNDQELQTNLASYFAQPLVAFLIRNEEVFEVIGLSMICFAVISCFIDPLYDLVRKNTKGVALMLVAGGILVAGNSFLHFQYGPSTRLRLSALVLTLIGFSGMVLANRLFLRDNARLSLVNQETFYVFLFAIFVILPTVYGNPDGPTALFLWFTTTILLGVFLFLRHPILHGRRKLV